jgi:hypothetical protein
MYGRRKPILAALMVDGGAATDGGSGTPPALPAGVAPGSAAASVAAPPAGGNGANGAGGNDAGRAGGPDALKADLAAERTKRHELEQKVAQLSTAAEAQADAIKKAFGLAPEQQTPEQLQAALTAQQAEHRSQLTQLTVHQLAAAAGADPSALLDSNKFLSSIKDLQPTDTAGITAAIAAAVASNKSLGVAAIQPVGAGARDAAQGGNNGGNTPSISDLFRAAKG